MSASYKMSPMKLSTAVKKLQKTYGKDKIYRQLVLDMLEVIGVQPYFNKDADDYWISSFDYYEINCFISDYSKGAPIDEIFNIGITNLEE